MTTPQIPVVFILALMLLMATAVRGQDFAGGGARERSPFTDIVFDGDRAQVLVGDRWFEWVGINNIDYETILAEARRRDQRDPRRRIAEDLVSILAGLGIEPNEAVRRELRTLDEQRTLVMPHVPMTRENRSLVVENRRERQAREAHALLERRASTRVDVELVFDELIANVRMHHAYADLKGLDLIDASKEEIDRIGTNPTLGEAVLAAQRFIARLGDGHASIDDWLEFAPHGRLDALFQHAKGGVVAFRRDPREATGELLDPDHPYVSSMDGVPIERWIEAASAYVTDGSPALVRRRSAGLLRYVNLIRDELDLPHDPTVDLRLRNADGSSTADLQITVTDRRGSYGVWPRSESRVLDSGIGYIRLDRMHRAGPELEAIERDLKAMADAPGLIIDVRGNGGGSRDAITRLVPWLLDAEADANGQQPARVINTARALLSVRDDPDAPNGHLANRRAFPASWNGWSPAERDAIDGFSTNFQPQWEPPHGRFSGPHYTVVSRKPGDPIYTGPVVVLMDEGCFSATDILLGALKGLPRVTLMGMPSSGGSARSRGHDIDSLGATVKLASMVSYMPDGRLYDGNGIQPDVLVPIEPFDLIGETDTQLDAAIEHLLAAAGQ